MNYNQAYLQTLINNRTEESVTLEYKSAQSLTIQKNRKDISKDASAFANAAGGIMIYGISEQVKPDNHLPKAIDPLNRQLISKEWLDQVISSRIKPTIQGITIHPIEIDGDPEKVVYLVEIPQSTTIHQAEDHKYYRRRNFKIDPMEDYEIREGLSRSRSPLINLEFEIAETIESVFSGAKQGSILGKYIEPDIKMETHRHLRVYAKNNGLVLAKYVNCFISFPERCLLKNEENKPEIGILEFQGENTVQEVVGLSGVKPIYGPLRYDPILPGLSARMNVGIPRLSEAVLVHPFEIKWTVHADNAEPQSGTVIFRDLKTVIIR